MDKAIEGIKELILKWKGQEADMLTIADGWLFRTIDSYHELHILQQCIADLQALYAELVD